jgi:drug/metabolite transporter (DMT)-like permease
VLLRERIAPTSWLGIACIVIGILLVSSAVRS